MKKCPYCAESIQDDAIKCKHCGSMLVGQHENSTSADTGSSAQGLFGALIAVIGLAMGAGGALSGNVIVAIAGIALLIIGATRGSKYK